MFKPFLLTALHLFVSFCVLSQDVEMPNIVPPSPTAYELGKYGQIPVSMFTGSANVSVPLYEYKAGNLSVPISLSYNSNGIKVDQVSSNVGLGWSLNAGGVITRIIRDKPDEERGDNFPMAAIHESGVNGATDFFELAGMGEIDTETDLFMYNFMGHTGQFVRNEQGEFALVPYKALKIEKIPINGSSIDGFRVTTPDGIIYEFLEAETSMVRTTGAGHDAPSGTWPTSWKLTKITHPKGDQVVFDYQGNNYFYSSAKFEALKVKTGGESNGCPVPLGIFPAVKGPYTSVSTISEKKLVKISSNRPEYGEVSFTSDIYHPGISGFKLLSNLTVKDKSLNVIQNIDFTYLLTGNKRCFLKGVQFADPDKNYTFEYIDPTHVPERLAKTADYWGYNNGSSNSHYFPDVNGETIKPFLHTAFFGYTGVGANKEISTDDAKKGLLKRITYPTKGYNEFEYESNDYLGTHTDYGSPTTIELHHNIGPTSDPQNPYQEQTIGPISYNQQAHFFVNASFNDYECGDNMDTGHDKASLTITDDLGSSIIIRRNTALGLYPCETPNSVLVPPSETYGYYVNLEAGRTYTIKLEAHFMCTLSGASFTYYNQAPVITTANVKQGGLRIKSIKAFDLISNTETTDYYYYGRKETPTVSEGIKGRRPFNISYSTERRTCEDPNDNGSIPGMYADVYFQSLNSNSLSQLYSSTGTGTPYYKYVTKSSGSTSFEQGGVEHQYIIGYDYPGDILLGNPINNTPWVNAGWDNGLEKTQTVFKKASDGSLITLKETDNFYTKDDSHFEEIYAFSVVKKFSFILSNPIEPLANLDIMEYKTNSYWHYLSKTITRDFDDAGHNPVEKSTEYVYDNIDHLQLTQVKTSTSQGDKTLITKYDYPGDLPSEPYSSGLIASGQIGALLRTRTFKKDNDSSPEDLLSTRKTVYDLFSIPGPGLPFQPKRIQTAKGNTGLVDRMVIYDYDDYGNIREVSKANGVHISYIMGYNHTLPVAQIENATFSSIPTGIKNTIYTLSESGSEAQLIDALNDLRNALPDAMVTTYTYKPLIGVSTVTDPNGYTTSYEYDQYNRLKDVKDKDGNILTRHKYNYR